MPLLKKQEPPLWGIWKIEESGDELYSLLECKEWYRSFLDKVKMEHRRQEWLAARVLLKCLTGKEMRVDYKENGMPYLPDESSLHISISHTKGYAAVLLSKHPFPGIDIEYRALRVKKVASRFMSEQELLQTDKAHELEALHLYWSGKETVFKALQQQDIDFREHIYIHPFRPQASSSFRAEERRTPHHYSFSVNYEINNDFVVTYTLQPTSEET